MADTPISPTPRGSDDIGTPTQSGSALPLSQVSREALDMVDQAVESLQEEIAIVVDEEIREVDDAIRALEGDIRTVMAEAIGQVDLTLGELEAQADKVIESVWKQSIREVYGLEYDLRSAGVYVPSTADEIFADLMDETGTRMLNRLAGIDPTQDGAAAAPTTTYPEAPKVGDWFGSCLVTAVQIGAAPPDDGGKWIAGGQTPDGSIWLKCDAGPIPVSPPPPGPPPAPPPPPGPAPEPEPIPEPIHEPEPEPCACDDTPKDCRPLTDAVICWPGTATSPPPPPPPPAPPPDGEGEPEPEPKPVPAPDPKSEPLIPPPPKWTAIPPGAAASLPYHDPDICRQVRQWVDWFGHAGKVLRVSIDGIREQTDQIIQVEMVERGFSIVAGAVAGLRTAVTGSAEGLLALVHLAQETQGFIAQWWAGSRREFLSAMMQQAHGIAMGEASDAMMGCLLARSLLEWTGEHYQSWSAEYLGVDAVSLRLDPLPQIVGMCIQWLAPTVPPDLPAIRQLWLTGTIDDDHAACLVRLHGHQWPVTREEWLTSRLRPGVQESIALFRRGVITEEQLQFRLTELGVKYDTDRAAFYRLSEAVPNLSDLIPWMVRDVFDEEVVKKYGYDTDFERKWSEQAARWGFAQGIGSDYARAAWRAHWRIPSDTRLYEMVHRLRKDRPQYAAYLEAVKLWEMGGRAGIPPKEPPTVTLEDARRALEINDNAPTWVDALLAVSYHPINRTDAIDAYHAGAWGDEELYHAMRDNGYNDTDARRLVDIQRAKRGRRLANLSGVWTSRQIIAAFKSGAIDRVKADQLLGETVVDGRQRAALLIAADEQVRTKNRDMVMRRVRRAVFTGAIGTDDAAAELKGAGVADARIPDLLFQWQQEARGRYREPSARQIIQWAALNIITPDDAYARLLRLGYLDIDARRIVYQGIDAHRQSILRQVDKMEAKLEKQIRNAKQAKKEEQQTLEKRQKELEKQKKALEEEQERIASELERRRPQ